MKQHTKSADIILVDNALVNFLKEFNEKTNNKYFVAFDNENHSVVFIDKSSGNYSLYDYTLIRKRINDVDTFLKRDF